MKIDIHAHILPKTWPELRDRYGYGGWIQLDHHAPGCARMRRDDTLFREVEENLWDPAVRVEECDSVGVDVQVLSTVPVMFSYWAKPEHAHDLAKLLNDHIAECVTRYPKRFAGLGTLPMQHIPRAIQEMERCIQDLGMAGVIIGSHINAWNLDAEELYPFYEAAESLGAAIFVHPWDMMAMDKMPRYWLPWLVGMPAETSLAMCSITMGGIIEKWPGLRLAFAHGGGSFPGTLGRIQHGFRVRPDLCQVETRTEPADLMNRLWVDSIVHDPVMLDLVVKRFGADHVCLGSDYPFPLGEEHAGQLIESMTTFSPDIKETVLSTSALSWLDRPRADYETEASRAHSARLRAAAEEAATS